MPNSSVFLVVILVMIASPRATSVLTAAEVLAVVLSVAGKSRCADLRFVRPPSSAVKKDTKLVLEAFCQPMNYDSALGRFYASEF